MSDPADMGGLSPAERLEELADRLNAYTIDDDPADLLEQIDPTSTSETSLTPSCPFSAL